MLAFVLYVASNFGLCHELSTYLSTKPEKVYSYSKSDASFVYAMKCQFH